MRGCGVGRLGPVVLAPDVQHEHAGDEEERHHQDGHRAAARVKNHQFSHVLGIALTGGALCKVTQVDPSACGLGYVDISSISY